jgi:hypothetical protein
MVFLFRRPLNVLDSWSWESSLVKSTYAGRYPNNILTMSWLLCYTQTQFNFSLFGNSATDLNRRFQRL